MTTAPKRPRGRPTTPAEQHLTERLPLRVTPQCLAPRCEPVAELEPTVLHCWRPPAGAPKGPPVEAGGLASGVVWDDWRAAHERFFAAVGHGVTIEHPIRAEAVAQWREVVGRKR